MKLLLIGSGAREHALAWAISASPLLNRLWIAPGNAGTSHYGQNVTLDLDDFSSINAFAKKHQIDLVVIGPEAPLEKGLGDFLRNHHIKCFGPNKKPASLESSKSYLKSLATQYDIATAPWQVFDDAKKAHLYVEQTGAPIVIKADGLAAGKGVIIADHLDVAHEAIDNMMVKKYFGSSGDQIVIEKKLEGFEVSFFALCDGKTAIPFSTAQDYKRAYDQDLGPNTGGMGAFSPALIDADMHHQIDQKILQPLFHGFNAQNPNDPFIGVMFLGLMITLDGPQLIECNVRFGDPECQALMMRLQTDLLSAIMATVEGTLDHFSVKFSEQKSVNIVMAHKDYPNKVDQSGPIRGLDQFKSHRELQIFQAGTYVDKQNRLYADGGRVLSITALGKDLKAARETALQAIQKIDYPQGFFRRDIALNLSPIKHK
ncbi:MAG: phosphoribosylamine--glycine ligase [Pseudomonadota bacterium]